MIFTCSSLEIRDKNESIYKKKKIIFLLLIIILLILILIITILSYFILRRIISKKKKIIFTKLTKNITENKLHTPKNENIENINRILSTNKIVVKKFDPNSNLTIEKLIEMNKETIECFEAFERVSNNSEEKQLFYEYVSNQQNFTEVLQIFVDKINSALDYTTYIYKIINLILIKEYNIDVNSLSIHINTVAPNLKNITMSNLVQLVNKEEVIIDENDRKIVGIDFLVEKVNFYIEKSLKLSKELYDEDNLVLEVKEFAKLVFNIRQTIKDTDYSSIEEKINHATLKIVEIKDLSPGVIKETQSYELVKEIIDSKKYQTIREETFYNVELNDKVSIYFQRDDIEKLKSFITNSKKEKDPKIINDVGKINEKSIRETLLSDALTIENITFAYEDCLLTKKLSILKEKTKELSYRKILHGFLQDKIEKNKSESKLYSPKIEIDRQENKNSTIKKQKKNKSESKLHNLEIKLKNIESIENINSIFSRNNIIVRKFDFNNNLTIENLIEMNKETIECFEAFERISNNSEEKQLFYEYVSNQQNFEKVLQLFLHKIDLIQEYITYVDKIINLILIKEYNIDVNSLSIHINTVISNKYQYSNQTNSLYNYEYIKKEDIIEDEDDKKIDKSDLLIKKINFYLNKSLELSHEIYGTVFDYLVLDTRLFANHISNIRKIIKSTDYDSIKNKITLAKHKIVEINQISGYIIKEPESYELVKEIIDSKKYQTIKKAIFYNVELNEKLSIYFEKDSIETLKDLIDKRQQEKEFEIYVRTFLLREMFKTNLSYKEHFLVKKLDNLKEKKEELYARKNLYVLKKW